MSAHFHRPVPGKTFTGNQSPEKCQYFILREVVGGDPAFPHEGARFNLITSTGTEVLLGKTGKIQGSPISHYPGGFINADRTSFGGLVADDMEGDDDIKRCIRKG